jgi:hypothetical protein
MSDEAEDIAVEEAVVEIDEGQELAEIDEGEAEQEQSEQQEGETEVEESEPEEQEVVISVGDEEIEQSESAPSWVSKVRKTNREQAKRVRELEAQLKAQQEPAKTAATLSIQPKIEDFDYDSDAYETALFSWMDEKREVEAAQVAEKQAEESIQKEWVGQLEQYGEARKKLNVRDFEEAEDVVIESLNTTQQGIVIKGAKDSALLVYALGKNPKKAKELSDIKDPVKFAFAVARLESSLQVKGRKRPPPPERTVTNGSGNAGALDKTLDRLRNEAAKTGDMTKVLDYKRKNNL